MLSYVFSVFKDLDALFNSINKEITTKLKPGQEGVLDNKPSTRYSL